MKIDSTDVASDSKSAEYCSSLKGLNQCVSQWIKSHVDSNPFCILTPIFRDYERYLTKIDEKESKQRLGEEADVTQRTVKSPEKSPTAGGVVTEWCVYLYATIDVSRSWESIVCIATGYELDERGEGGGGSGFKPHQVKNFLHVLQTSSEAHPISCPMGAGRSFPGG